MSVDVDVLSPVLPTPSTVVHALLRASSSPRHPTLAVDAAQSELDTCPPPPALPAAEVAPAPSLNILCAAEPPCAAFLYPHSVSLDLPESAETQQTSTHILSKTHGLLIS